MSILGVNFTKIDAERKAPIKGKISINNNILITDVKKHDFELSGQNSIKVKFKFTAKYDPNVGTIEISGDTMFLDNPKKIEEILTEWKKDKKLNQDILAEVMNSLLTKCNVEALIVGREVGLPPTLNMPKVKIKE